MSQPPSSGAVDPSTPHAHSVVHAVRVPLGRVRRGVRRRGNRVLVGLQQEPTGQHLVPSPVFVLSPPRSGSTLLRSLLNMHTRICAPHELHLATLRVASDRPHAIDSWAALGMSTLELENLLWDRVLHRALVRSGKRIVVDKTPQNAAVWPRIHEYWPQARYLHLHRHPGSIFDSLMRADPQRSRPGTLRTLNTYGQQLRAARDALPGPTVRYEDLVRDPETALRSVSDYLGVRFQPQMLTYKTSFARVGLGDWSSNIKSGRVQPARPLPTVDETPAELRALTAEWGY